MSSYLYILGRTADLALLELQAKLSKVFVVATEVAQSDERIPIDSLGGTVKIAQIVGELKIPPGSTFGISVYGGKKIDTAVLNQLKKHYKASRFIEPQTGTALSSVVIQKHHVTEFIMVGNVVAKTIAVQDFEEWNRRDYGRPYADPKSGMLPPKVARMIVNISGSDLSDAQGLTPSQGLTPMLLDPFCGMGTILGEALLSGWHVVGSDQSPEVIEKAKKNLEWLSAKNFQLFVSDAAHISESLAKESIDAIVTEPFMGSVRYPKSDIRNLIKGLEKLYIGCLKDWHRVLKPSAKIVIALPQYHIGAKTYFVKKVIDRCETLGYTTLAGPIEYSRQDAIVRRQFYVFIKN